MLLTRFIDKPLAYTGPELRPHFLLSEFGLRGSALAAFIGPCHVKTESMVDWEDRLAEDRIDAERMVHFLGEFFGSTLREAVWVQRLFVAQLESLLRERTSRPVRRIGDDLFVEDRKLSVSIVTASPVSQLLHLGLNIDPTGAPVPAIGLQELGIDGPELAKDALKRFSEEWEQVSWACAKVRPVM